MHSLPLSRGVPAALRLHRRTLLGAATLAFGSAAGLLALGEPPALAVSGRDQWRAFRARYVTAEGRVVDTGNGGVSHSEGQGYGLLLAASHDDRAVFDQLLSWTLGNLSRLDDRLLGWRRVPGQPRLPTDENNATDGDLLVAWGLARAAGRWGAAEYRRRAEAMARDILRLCTVEAGGRLLLRPGMVGFDRGEELVVNLGYYVFPALRELAALLPDPRWARLERDGRTLLAAAATGPRRLLPDWLELPRRGGAPHPAHGWPARFSWDAVRIPLHLVWAGLEAEPVLDPLMEVWFDPALGTPPPAWWDLRGDLVAPYPATPGIMAVARLLLAARTRSGRTLPIPPVAEAQDYYNAALIALAHLAAEEVATSGALLS